MNIEHTTRGTRPSDKTAVVLSGGGADGAYGVGTLKALLNGRSPANGNRHLVPDVLAGTSIGSFNAAFIVSWWQKFGAASIGDLETVWLDRLASVDGCTNGAYRFKADPWSLLPRCALANPAETVARFARDSAELGWEGLQRAVHFTTSGQDFLARTAELLNFSSFISREPWTETIRQAIDFQAIRDSDRELRVVATNWTTGQLRTFENSDMGSVTGPKIIEASSAVPGFFQPGRVGSQVFVDGGVLQNTPLTPAIDSGATEIYIIYLDPDIRSVPLADEENTLETLYRMQQIAWASSIETDIAAARRINEMLEILDDASSISGSASHPSWNRLRERYARFRPLEIHRFSPREDPGGGLGLLNLELPRIQDLIQRGFEDAVEHDCETNGCVLARSREPTAPGTRPPRQGEADTPAGLTEE